VWPPGPDGHAKSPLSVRKRIEGREAVREDRERRLPFGPGGTREKSWTKFNCYSPDWRCVSTSVRMTLSPERGTTVLESRNFVTKLFVE